MSLSKPKLERFLQQLVPDMKRSELNYVHAMVDMNQDGLIEFKEFSTAVKECRTVGAAARTGGGLHSSTSRLNLSAFCGLGVHSGDV